MIKSIKIIFISLLILTGIVQLEHNLIYKNISISEPLGYYFAIPFIPIRKDDLVLTCISNKTYKHVFNELGLKNTTGQCENGMPYLIKQVVAMMGDNIEVIESGILINGILYKDSKQFTKVREVKLYPLPIGYSHILKDNEYFMMGDSIHSVDSRYFGIVNIKDIYSKTILIYETK